MYIMFKRQEKVSIQELNK